ncbi:N(6)-adenine-specific methyltransferase METTL4 isoform X2 [Planococcus citri]|uniref:N(6)-adenine-specific methyltransferase METTL4 isoform X2 n=1 Tax=Planococcus citri TaxID=170843 RepID=UPI0031FA2B4C
MSVIWSNEYGWLVCHSLFLRKIYDGVVTEEPCPDCHRYRLFHIDEPFLKRGQKDAAASTGQAVDVVRPIGEIDVRNLGNYSADDFKWNEIVVLSTVFKNFVRDLLAAKSDYFVANKCRNSTSSNNATAINVANSTLTRLTASNDQHFDGGNSNDQAVAANVRNESYLIPPRCRFYNYDIDRISEKLSRDEPLYDFMLIDPPWQNKHVRRKNASPNPALGYNLMKADHLATLPVDEYLSASGLIAVWCTNSTQQIDTLLNCVFPRWKVEYVATWYWIKITQSARPICEFSTTAVRQNQKQPFERIIFASRQRRSVTCKNPPPNKILVSIPSAVHSHKPPLVDVMKEYLPADCRCIELFARYLLPNWTSYGNQVLGLQSSSLFS